LLEQIVSYIETLNQLQKQALPLARAYRDNSPATFDSDKNKAADHCITLWTAAFDICEHMNELNNESFKFIVDLLKVMQAEIKAASRDNNPNNPALREIVATSRTFMDQIIADPQIVFIQRAAEIDNIINEHAQAIYLLEMVAKLHQQLISVRNDVINIDKAPAKKSFPFPFSGLFSPKMNKVADISQLKQAAEFKTMNLQQLDSMISAVAAIKDYSDWNNFIMQQSQLRVTRGSFQDSWVISRKISEINDLVLQTHTAIAAIPDLPIVNKSVADALKPAMKVFRKSPVGKMIVSPSDNDSKLTDAEKSKLVSFKVAGIPQADLNLVTFFLDENKFADLKMKLSQTFLAHEKSLSIDTEKVSQRHSL
jgi:hypothetical protein